MSPTSKHLPSDAVVIGRMTLFENSLNLMKALSETGRLGVDISGSSHLRV